MKKLFLMLSVAGLATFSLTSCGKEHEEKPAIKQTITVQLQESEAYTFVLPKNKRDDAYDFTTQASHYAISVLSENTLGQRIYQYTPALNYTGTDQVIVSNDFEREEDHSNQPCGQQGGNQFGNCTGGNGGPEDHYIITIDFTIGRVATSNAK